MNEAWIIDACRTPRGIGKQGKGALADMHSQHLGAAVLKALAETGMSPADALMIGDTSYDMAMGRAAGVRTLGVTWGYHTRDQLMASGAERLVESYEDLTAVLASGQCWD